jgi:uncharacterized protein YbgA (DUF1722 family)/uncharacterized protein YbbK (DUF523 family)
MDMRIKLGISTCLLGENVRWNGGHSRDRYITDTLGQYVDFVPVCPEVECGFGVPREAFRLVGDPESPRLMTRGTKIDHTDRMLQWARKRVVELEREGLCGFIFKSRSPSSGMERVKVYNERGMPVLKGVGLFARTFMEHFPVLPVEEDGRLHDPRIRENFIERIFVFKRWREMMAERPTRGDLVDFHTRHKLLILAHSPKDHRILGKLVADAKSIPLGALLGQYQSRLMEALRLKTTIKKNINVLLHMLGFFKRQLSPDEKQELLEIVDHYRGGHVPLIVPITLMNHYVRKYGQPYLHMQYYLNPHPIELQLRNHV